MSDNNNLETNNPSSKEKAEGISEHADSIDAEVAGGDGIDDMKGISKETESLHDRSKEREVEDREEAERILVEMKEKRASAREGETPLSSPENKAEGTPKEIFLNSLEEELSQMEKDGTISSERAEDKRRAAASIEEGFTDDPKGDALAFISAGVFFDGESGIEDDSVER